jgi:2-oxoglutarate ferredoxin oxidoreductase subunit beta
MGFNYFNYVRKKNLPHIWCPGCSHGIVMKALIRAVDSLGIDKNKLAIVSGIGCSSRMPGYMDANTLHTTHGRAIAFATGMKLVNPELNIVLTMGDGDALAIGGNHFIHAARRNIDLTVLILNNAVYGMTGGQLSPTTFESMRTTTSPYGHLEPPFDAVELALGSGATFVARTTAFHIAQLTQYIKKAIQHKGFSVVDVMSWCHTALGRRNKMASPIDWLEFYKKNSVPYSKVGKTQVEGKIVIGIFRDEKKAEYTEKYYELIKKVKEG